jgi:predicted protein tyrosine phosphatase
MIREDLYYRLIAYAKKVCQGLGYNYLDLTHDVICRGGITETNFANIFLELKEEVLRDQANKPFSIDLIPAGKPVYLHKYCPMCDDIYPEHEFYTTAGNAKHKHCKKCHNKIRWASYNRVRDRTDYQRELAKKHRAEIKNGYVIDILVKNGFSRIDITEEMIIEKKKAIYLKRQKKLNKVVV